MKQQTDEWHKYRAGRVGASRIKDVMAGGQGKTRANYMAEIIAARLTGSWPESFQSDAMLRGIELESQARLCYEFITGNEVVQEGFVDHPEIDMAGCSPDGLVGSVGLVEIKTVKPAVQIKYLLDNKIPAEYNKQVQWQLATTGRDWNDFVSYCPELGEDLQIFIKRTTPDEKLISEMESSVKKFLAEVDETIIKLKGTK